MGKPLTKVVLTASSYGAFRATQDGFLRIEDVRWFENKSSWQKYRMDKFLPRQQYPIRMYVCAGDDHLGIGNPKGLQMVPSFLETMGYKLSNKYDMSKKIISYCQSYGVNPLENPIAETDSTISQATGKRLGGAASGRIHIDTPKTRLLCQTQKMGGRENFDSPDPLVGKANALCKSYWMEAERIARIKDNPDKISIPQVARYVERMERYHRFLPTAIRALMPTWFEKKVFSSRMAYLPTAYGGLGIPLTAYDLSTDEKALRFAKDFQFQKDQVVDYTELDLWERGVDTKAILIGKMIRESRGEIDITYSYEEARKYAEQKLQDGNNSSIGRLRIAKALWSEFIDLSGEVPLVDSKETAYVQLALEPDPEISLRSVTKKKTRSRQKLRRIVSSVAKGVKAPEAYDLSKGKGNWYFGLQLTREGQFVRRDLLTQVLGTTTIKPDLKINRETIMGPDPNGSKYAPVQFPIDVEAVETCEPDWSHLRTQSESSHDPHDISFGSAASLN